jgi:hypothetical protein
MYHARMTNIDTAQVLEDAADLLLVHGRCKTNAKDKDGRFCVVGAVMAARGHNVLTGCVVMTVLNEQALGYADPALVPVALHVDGSSNGLAAALWNDRTEDDFEVIDTLRHVAKDLRNSVV